MRTSFLGGTTCRGNFSQVVKDSLEKREGNFRNILIKGPANTEKTFLLSPLNVVYRSFSNPATSTFAWVGTEKEEVIFLNDFKNNSMVRSASNARRTARSPSCPQILLFQDLEFTRDTTIFGTTKHDLVYVKGGLIDESETEMMAVRWHSFQFQRQIREAEQLSIPSCARCIAEFIPNF